MHKYSEAEYVAAEFRIQTTSKNRRCQQRHMQHLPPVLRIRSRDPGIRCHMTPGPGSGIRNRFFLQLSDKFLSKKFYNSLKTGPHFFLQHLKNKIIFNFVKFVPTKKGLTTNFFSPLSFVAFLDPGSGMGKN